MNRALSSEMNIAEGRRYVTGLINMGLRFGSNPRRKNPQTSALGSIAIAGLAGFLIGKN
jgi:hypothetical protein